MRGMAGVSSTRRLSQSGEKLGQQQIRGPILLCVDTSGSMRGSREVVAKALALECMRAARAQV